MNDGNLKSVYEQISGFEESMNPFNFKITSRRTIENFDCPCTSRPRILIVDDNIFNLVTLESVLELQFSLKADRAMNGQEAVEMLLKRHKQSEE